MANYTAADVKKIREITGSGMMDCKKALTEADGDHDRAIEILRLKGAKDVGKRAGRSTAEGLVAQSGCSLIEINCETDFVAKNQDFQDFAGRLVALVDEKSIANVESLMSAPFTETGTVEDAVNALSAKIGEKILVRRLAKVEGHSVAYMHKRSTDLPPAVGVLVSFSQVTEEQAETAKAIAMHIAALRPRFVRRDEVPEDIIATERRIAEQMIKEENRPEAAIPKIIEGRINSYYKDNVLLEQPSVTDPKKTILTLAKENGLEVTGFVRFEVGQE